MFDLVIAGATVVTPSVSSPCTVGVAGGRIAALAAPGEILQARQHVDATERLLLPGLVDAHVHFREPGLAHKEGFRNGTRAAAVGGVTTVIVMPTDVPATLTCDDFLAKRALAEGQVHVDFALQAAVGLDLSQLDGLTALGAASFEIFPGVLDPLLRLDDGAALVAALEAVGRTGRLCGISPGEATLVAARIAALRGAGRRGFGDFAMARPPLGEAMSLARCAVAAGMLGVPSIFRQISCRASLDALRDARRRWPHILGETNPHYLALTAADILKLQQSAVMAPPLRTEDDRCAMWEGLHDGTLDIVSTDHAPHLPQEKDAGLEDVWATPLGIPGVQTLLPVMLARAARGDCTLQQIVAWCCESPARLFGLFPAKGCIAVGSDADFVIVDPTRSTGITDATQVSRAERTPFAGLSVPAAIERVLLRGVEIARGDAVVGGARGHFIAHNGKSPS